MTTRRTRRDERGSMAVEIVILTPVLFAFVLLVVVFGKYVGVRGDVDAAARDAAREASFQTSRGAAEAAARQTVAVQLDGDTTCQRVAVDLTGWGPGGEVAVDLRCSTSLAGLGLIGVPGAAQVSGDAVVPLDPYRSYQ